MQKQVSLMNKNQLRREKIRKTFSTDLMNLQLLKIQPFSKQYIKSSVQYQADVREKIVFNQYVKSPDPTHAYKPVRWQCTEVAELRVGHKMMDFNEMRNIIPSNIIRESMIDRIITNFRIAKKKLKGIILRQDISHFNVILDSNSGSAILQECKSLNDYFESERAMVEYVFGSDCFLRYIYLIKWQNEVVEKCKVHINDTPSAASLLRLVCRALVHTK